MKEVIKSIFSNGGLSSKRIFGGLGIATILVCYVIAVADHAELPSVTEFLFAGCVTLLGCDSVVNAISKNKEVEQ